MFMPLRRTALLLAFVTLGCAHGSGTSEGAAEPAAASPETEAPAAKVAAGQPHMAPETTGQEVSYTSGSATLEGYLAYPTNAAGKRPGVLVVHEWWGLNDHARNVATKLAQLGYVALAVDMYGDGKVASHPEDAKSFMMSVMSNPKEAAARCYSASRVQWS